MLNSIFSVDIYRVKFDNLEILARARVAAEKLNFSAISTENADRYPGTHVTLTSRPNNNQVHAQPEFNELTKFIEQHAKHYWDQLGFYPDVSPKIWTSWSNITESAGSIHSHNHCKSPLTAVMYLEAQGDCGNLVFENPMELILGGQPIKMPYNNFVRPIQVTTGDIVLFPGYLKHYTEANNSSKLRVTFVSLLNERGF